MLKLKLQYFGHLMRRVDSLEKTDAGRDRGQEEKGTTEDEMAGWHHFGAGRDWGKSFPTTNKTILVFQQSELLGQNRVAGVLLVPKKGPGSRI